MRYPTGIGIRLQLARSIRVIRILRGWSQEQLGENANLHRSYVGAVERAERNISVDNIEKIARALEVPVSSLFCETEIVYPVKPSNKPRIREIRPSYIPNQSTLNINYPISSANNTSRWLQ